MQKENTDNRLTPTATPVEYCLAICRRILGLRNHEIVKILGISRSELNFHQQGRLSDLSGYRRLARFAEKVEFRYGESISKVIRSVLIENKTLVQHLISNRGNLDKALLHFDTVHKKIGNIKQAKTDIDPNVAATRFANIGRMA